MGRLISTIDFTGFSVNGIILGYPSIENEMFVWEAGGIPDGVLEVDGTITNILEEAEVTVGEWAGLRDISVPDVTVDITELLEEIRETVPAPIVTEPELETTET